MSTPDLVPVGERLLPFRVHLEDGVVLRVNDAVYSRLQAPGDPSTWMNITIEIHDADWLLDPRGQPNEWTALDDDEIEELNLELGFGREPYESQDDISDLARRISSAADRAVSAPWLDADEDTSSIKRRVLRT